MGLMYEIQLRQLMPTSWKAADRGLRPTVLIVSCSYSLALEELKLHTLRMRRHRLDVLCLNSVLLFRKLLAPEFLLGISETSLCSMSTPHVKIVPQRDVYQLLMLLVGTLTLLGAKSILLNHIL
jgi:hypothetical protein